MRIVFAGHFSIGDILQPNQIAGIAKAKEMGGDLAILVNDIDLKRRMRFFQHGGLELLLKHLTNKRKCGSVSSICKVQDIHALQKRVDWNLYQDISVKISSPKEDIDMFLREHVVPGIIDARLRSYKIPKKLCKVFTERILRNKASVRLAHSRSGGSASWVPMLQECGLLERVKSPTSQIPICGGILLALFEEISKLGYDELVQIYSNEDRPAIENGTELLHVLHSKFPLDKRWGLKITNIFI